ncbi:hypothetical protein O3Q51_17700 [Cryomorphaceae bacterium 1068]|nr:hypothetical protein [Cryomorphaceae bacterium 1068]
MASAFWTLEDGRGFARRWTGMKNMLELICEELKDLDGAELFYDYLKEFIYREDEGDIYNGFGGFIRNGENIMFNFDLRTFTPENRKFFWEAAQKALAKVKVQNEEKNWWIDYALTTLLDMHKRINKGEDPMALNHMTIVKPKPNEKVGPGWK